MKVKKLALDVEAAEAKAKALETGTAVDLAADPPATTLLNYVLESKKQAETRATDVRARTEILRKVSVAMRAMSFSQAG